MESVSVNLKMLPTSGIKSGKRLAAPMLVCCFRLKEMLEEDIRSSCAKICCKINWPLPLRKSVRTLSGLISGNSIGPPTH